MIGEHKIGQVEAKLQNVTYWGYTPETQKIPSPKLMTESMKKRGAVI